MAVRATTRHHRTRMAAIHPWMVSDLPWDLFRTFEVVARLGSFTAASKMLGISQSTVSRHLALLEEEAGSSLVLRGRRVEVTERGDALLAAVKGMAEAATSARAALEPTGATAGQVTLAAVGEVVRWTLAHHLDRLYRKHPELRLRILGANQLHSLAADEADVALRWSRPERGALVARRLVTESFGYFAASSLELHRGMPWLGLTGSLAQISEQRHAEQAFGSRKPRLLVEDIDSLGIAIASGLGVGVLPRMFAARLQGVVEVRPMQIGVYAGPIPSRAMWLVVHRSKRNLPKVRAVMRWVEGIFTRGSHP